MYVRNVADKNQYDHLFWLSNERFAKSSMRTNHCVDKYGSTTAPDRSE